MQLPNGFTVYYIDKSRNYVEIKLGNMRTITLVAYPSTDPNDLRERHLTLTVRARYDDLDIVWVTLKLTPDTDLPLYVRNKLAQLTEFDVLTCLPNYPHKIINVLAPIK
jgi:hypothetical protein